MVQDTNKVMNLVIGGVTEDTPDEAAGLLGKAASDPAFKAQLIADPKGTARMELGVMLPDDLDIVVHENTPSAVYLVLPPAEAAAGELSDLELETVAGGRRRRSSGGGGGGGGGGGNGSNTGPARPGVLAICT